MEATPEILRVFSQKRHIEVCRNVEPKQAARADGHIAVARKIKVEVGAIGNRHHHAHGQRKRLMAPGLDDKRINQHGKQELLDNAGNDLL